MHNAPQDLDEALLLPGFLANASDTASGAGRPKSQRVIQVCRLSAFIPCLLCDFPLSRVFEQYLDVLCRDMWCNLCL